MLEKDIENLISRHPEEFLPYSNLKLIGQQVRLGTYSADIIFEDAESNKLIIEVKRGILSRDAIPQILDYYGILKIQEKSSNIKLIIIANVIPKERVLLLSEKLVDIKFIEIPISKIVDVAKKYSYSFLDEDKKTKAQYKEQTIHIDTEISDGQSNVWIFQSNPQTYDILNALANKDELKEGMWLVSRFKDKIQKGDIAIIWMSATNPKSYDAGIYAMAEITTNPEYIESPSKYWMSEDDTKKKKNLRVRLHYKILLVNNPILREELKSIPELSDMFIFRQPQGTNFPVTQAEWKVISGLLKERFDI